MRHCLTVLHWTPRQLADQVGCHDALVRQWLRGGSRWAIPPAVTAWLERRAAAAEPVPTGWRTRAGRQRTGPVPAVSPGASPPV